MDNLRRRRIAKLEIAIVRRGVVPRYFVTASGNETDIRAVALQERGISIDAPDVLLIHLVGLGSAPGPAVLTVKEARP